MNIVREKEVGTLEQINVTLLKNTNLSLVNYFRFGY
jgi:hypothetical protein